MPNATPPDQDPLEATIAPFYRAIGKATVRWQHVEAGLFVLTHAILGTDNKFSSVVFFHIQSADAKVQLVDRLCRAYFDEGIVDEWGEIHKDLRDALPFRNAMAHWEANFIIDPSFLELGEPPIALTRHHLDIRSEADTRVLSTSTATEVADEYLVLAGRLLRFVAAHFSIEKLRATHLQPRLLQYLENIQTDPPAPLPPRRPSPASPPRRSRRRTERRRR